MTNKTQTENRQYGPIRGTLREMDRGEFYAPIGLTAISGLFLSKLLGDIARDQGHNELGMGLTFGGAAMIILCSTAESVRTAYRIYSSKRELNLQNSEQR